MHEQDWSEIKKKPQAGAWGPFFHLGEFDLTHHDDVRCLLTLRTVRNLKLHLISFGEGLKSLPVDGGEVNENVISVIPGNESEALLFIEPFHSTFGHPNSPPFISGLK
jgi:hypothetical protein